VEQFFTSLSKRQTMLLLTSLAFGGSSSVAAFEHLPADEEELLKHRASQVLQIPRDKRIPLLVQEIKRLVTQRRRQLGAADPKRLAAVLRGERPALVEVVLRALPGDLTEAVRAELGEQRPAQLVRDVKPEVLSIIRWKLEEALKQGAPQVGSFRFTDLLTLQARELLAISDRMGARVLATAVAGMNDADREKFVAQLPPDQRALAARAAEAGRARRLSEDDARLVLEMHGALENPSEGLRSAGVQRIVRACVAQGAEFAQRVVERHPGDLGKLLARWLREEKHKPVKGDGGRLDIVEQMERLAQKNIIDRPMRLPPPVRPPPPAAPPGPAPLPPSFSPTPTRQPLPRLTGSTPGVQPPPPPPRKPTAPKAPAAPVQERPANAQRPSVEDSQVQRRIMRDGKPLETVGPAKAPGRKPTLSPALQAIPKRRERPEGARSPVLKGPGRGPSGNNE
jgi:hypothetical protein